MTHEQFLESLDKRIAECEAWLSAHNGDRGIQYYTCSAEKYTLRRVKMDFLTLTPTPTTLS